LKVLRADFAEAVMPGRVSHRLDLPMWLPEEAKAMPQVSNDRASAEALLTGPIRNTIRDLLARWASINQ